MTMDKPIEKKKGLQRKHLYWAVGGLLLAFLIWKAVTDIHGSTFRAEKDKLTISAVEAGQFNDYISVIGQVEPISTIYLDAEEGGKVEQILIEEGEMVKAGDVILKLKNNDLTLNIMNSESNLAYHTNELRNTRIQMEQQKIANRQQLNQTDFELKRLERTYRQQKDLYADKLIAYEDFLRAEEEYEFKKQDRDLIYRKLVQDSIFRENQKHAMDENLVNMQANLSMVQQRLQDLDVKAPVDGQLGLLKAQIGESIGKGQRIGQVNVLTSYKITAMVDEHYIDRIRPGLPATIERNDKTLNLVVKKVYPEVRSGQFEIDLVFEGEAPENLRTGQTFHVRIELGEPEKAIMVPRGGFFQSTGGQWIFVLDPAEKEAFKRKIQVGRQNPMYFEILDGLKPGEKVITSGYELFGDNDRIVLR